MQCKGSWSGSYLKRPSSSCRGRSRGFCFGSLFFKVLTPWPISARCLASDHWSAQWCVPEKSSQSFRHRFFSDVSFMVECLWSPIIWGTRDCYSCVHQSKVWVIRLTRCRWIWCFYILLVWSGLWVRPLISGMCQGGAHWWSARCWVDLVRSFPIYMDINEEWFPFIVLWCKC